MFNTHRIALTFAPEEPNSESLEAIREGAAFLTSGKKDVLTMVAILSQRRWNNEHADHRILCRYPRMKSQIILPR